MAIELVSYDDLQDLMGLGESAISDYPALVILRDSVRIALEEYTGREFESMARTESIYVLGPTTMIMLKALPVASVASLIVTISQTSETYEQYDDYEITNFGLQLLSSIQNATIAITYTGGFTTATVPDNISRAAILQTTYEFQSKEHIGATSVTNEGGTVNRPQLGLLTETKRMLASQVHPLKV